jgi:hypothetical protein
MDPMFAFCSVPVKRRPSLMFPPPNQWICPVCAGCVEKREFFASIKI